MKFSIIFKKTACIGVGDDMEYNFEFFSNLVKSLQTPKRFRHTLGVQKEAEVLGRIYMPSKVDKLSLAGLLHDITKDFKKEKQIELCKEYDIYVDYENLIPKLLHSKTGCEYSRRLFGVDIIDDEIYSGIFYHTTGREGMTMFESIIYLADYIEEGRDFSDCVFLRKFFYDNLSKAENFEDKLQVLQKTMLKSFDLSIRNLIEEGKQIDYDTIKARNYFLKNEMVFKTEG